MDRSIVYTSALPRTVDFLNANKFAMIGTAFAMKCPSCAGTILVSTGYRWGNGGH